LAISTNGFQRPGFASGLAAAAPLGPAEARPAASLAAAAHLKEGAEE
jgi:hypothetical protein